MDLNGISKTFPVEAKEGDLAALGGMDLNGIGKTFLCPDGGGRTEKTGTLIWMGACFFSYRKYLFVFSV